jgi:transposase
VRFILNNRQWYQIKPVLPKPAKTGRPRYSDRRVINGIIYVLSTGICWYDLPRRFGSPTTCWRRLRDWQEQGVWERIWRKLISTLDRREQIEWRKTFLDSSFISTARDKKGETKSVLPRSTDAMAVNDTS